ncbi:MAG: hypothetical protein AAF899_08655 [Pseudomonadota bacterium]
MTPAARPWWLQRLWRQRRRFLILPLLPIATSFVPGAADASGVLLDLVIVTGCGVLITLFAPRERHLTWPAIAAALAVLNVLEGSERIERLPVVVMIGLLYATTFLTIRYGVPALDRLLPVLRRTIRGRGFTALAPDTAFARMFNTAEPWDPSIARLEREGDRLMIIRRNPPGHASPSLPAEILYEDPPRRMVLRYVLAAPRQAGDSDGMETLPDSPDLVVLDRQEDDIRFEPTEGGTRMVRDATRNRTVLQHFSEWLDDAPGQLFDTFAAVAERRDDLSLSGEDYRQRGHDPDAPDHAF